MNDFNNIFISVKFDSMDIKNNSVWSIALFSPTLKKALYIEPQEKRSENIPKEIWEKFYKESYFLGMEKADATIGGIYEDGSNFPINIFTDEKSKVIEKVKKYFIEIQEKNNKPIKLFFENSFDYVMFINSCFEIDNNGNIKSYEGVFPTPITIESVCSMTNTWNDYITAKEKFISDSIESIKKINGEDSQEYLMFVKLSSVIEAMFIGDFYKLFF